MNSDIMNFKEKEETFKIKLNPYVILNLKKLNEAWGILYFTDEMGNIMNIPLDFYVFLSNYATNTQTPINNVSKRQYYELAWMSDYVIFYKKEMVLHLKSQRLWELNSPKEITIS